MCQDTLRKSDFKVIIKFSLATPSLIETKTELVLPKPFKHQHEIWDEHTMFIPNPITLIINDKVHFNYIFKKF